MENTTKVNKTDFEVYQFFSGYYGICKKNENGGGLIFGGDAADEDCYNRDYIELTMELWDGTLEDSGNSNYGIEGYVLKHN
jgi:hypothetical protein